MDGVILWQRAEGALVFLVGIGLYILSGATISWWGAVLVFFIPDLSFAAYLFGPAAGAALYNLLHVYAFGAVVLLGGEAAGVPLAAAFGALWLAHTGFDRMLGYGLKESRGFSFTHLGVIGRD